MTTRCPTELKTSRITVLRNQSGTWSGINVKNFDCCIFVVSFWCYCCCYLDKKGGVLFNDAVSYDYMREMLNEWSISTEHWCNAADKEQQKYFEENLFRIYHSDSLRTGRSGDRILVRARFSAPTQTGPGAQPSSYTIGTGSFSRG